MGYMIFHLLKLRKLEPELYQQLLDLMLRMMVQLTLNSLTILAAAQFFSTKYLPLVICSNILIHCYLHDAFFYILCLWDLGVCKGDQTPLTESLMDKTLWLYFKSGAPERWLYS